MYHLSIHSFKLRLLKIVILWLLPFASLTIRLCLVVIFIVFKAIFYNIESGIYNISGAETLSVKEVVYLLFRLFNKDISDNIFGQTTRIDSSMKILKLDGNKLFQSINYNPKIKISNVYERYE
jgi:hypothetical protein